MNENIIQMGPWDSTPVLPEIYRWGIEAISLIQQIENPALTALVKFITTLGSEYFYIPVILLIFWWIDEKKGLRLGILILVSAWINTFLKEVLQQPRPFHIDPSLGLTSAAGYGIPSGHAQNSLVFWIPLAAWLSQIWEEKQQTLIRKLPVWTFTIFIIILIGFSRLYLGVHFPTDLFAGWALGLFILTLWFIPGPFLTEKLSSANIRVQNISAAVIALIMNGLLPDDRTIPALFLGFCLGYNIMKQRFPFLAQAEIDGKKPGVKIKLIRCLIGYTGMALLFIVLRLILPGGGSLFADIPLWGQASPLYETGHFIRYGILGFWVSAGAPYIFQRLRLTS
jgi:membrane-associated phospholipid phosphatase